MRVLLDANVLISAAIRPGGTPGLVVAAVLDQGTLELVLSPSIIAEVELALKLPKIRRYLAAPEKARLWLADLTALAVLVEDSGSVKNVCRDPDDDAVLSAAVEGRAEVVVTGDDDLLALLEFEGIRVVTPRAFLDLLRGS